MKDRTEERISIDNHLDRIDDEVLKQEILQGLKGTPKRIPSKFFYDKRGSALFEEITRLEEYYPTRCEKYILKTLGGEIRLGSHGNNELKIIELGSGDSSKIRLFLHSFPPDRLSRLIYYPVDISEDAIRGALSDLTHEFPMLRIRGIVADFLEHLRFLPRSEPRLFCFFGSTIGNMDEPEADRFMAELGRQMQPGDHLLLGLDMVKDVNVLENAYNDEPGVTARFNKNILFVANELLDADFDPESFEHRAFYHRERQRIEMHLLARKNMLVRCGKNGPEIDIRQGEGIHTENSRKFSRDQIHELADRGQLKVNEIFADPKGWFSVVHYTK